MTTAPSFNISNPASTTVRAALDEYTTHVTLPVDSRMAAWFTIKGDPWGEEETYGPSPSAIEIQTFSGKQHGSYRLSRDASFSLPADCERLEARVVERGGHMQLTLSVVQPLHPSARAVRPAPAVAAAVPIIPPVPARPTPCVGPITSPASTPPARRLRGQRGGRGRSRHHGALEQQAAAVD
jgi:hypothetical protein